MKPWRNAPQMGSGRRRGWVFVLSSPSGGGKTTVITHLLRRLEDLVHSVSLTTRAPRTGESDGREYHFVSVEEFQRLRRSGKLLEWAKVHGAYYGTPSVPLKRALAQGKDVVLTIDVQGARQIRRSLGEAAVLVFLEPPSMAHLRQRLQARRTESAQDIRHRMAAAVHEMACVAWYDYRVVNDRLQEAVNQLAAIVLAQRCRVLRDE